MLQIVYTVPMTAEDAKTYSYRAAVPIRRACPVVAPPFALSEADTWNCNLCGADMPFFAPFLRGDIMPLQTNFADAFNTDPTNPTYGFKTTIATDFYVMVELQDANGATISSLIDTFADTYYVGYSEKWGSVQTFFINTGYFPVGLKCFRLKITYYKFDQISSAKVIERVLYSEYYREYTNCGPTILIESTYQGMDCYGNIYDLFAVSVGAGTTNAYYNSIRIEGEIEFTGNDESADIATDLGKVVRRTILSNYRINSGIAAPYFARMLDRVVRGSTVTINGEQYKNFVFEKNNDQSRMWVIDLTFEKECRLDNRGCNL